MLDNSVADPNGIEGPAGSSFGLGLLDMKTTLAAGKQLSRESGYLTFADAKVAGYEIHAGTFQGVALNNPAVKLMTKNDDAISDDNQILGTYLHGLFDHSQACEALLKWAGLEQVQSIDYRGRQEADINRLADAIEAHLELDAVYNVLNLC